MLIVIKSASNNGSLVITIPDYSLVRLQLKKKNIRSIESNKAVENDLDAHQLVSSVNIPLSEPFQFSKVINECIISIKI